MAEQLLINVPYATSRQVERHLVMDQKLRLYRESPDRLQLQIRTHSDKRGRISSVTLSAAQARQIADKLIELAAELRE